MSEQTKIEWCDSTLNFWEGCTKISDGCKNCYAAERDWRFTLGKHWGNGAPRRKSKSTVKDALRMNRYPFVCDVCGTGSVDVSDEHGQGSYWPCGECSKTTLHHLRRIFSLSLGDWLDDEVPIEWLAEMLNTIRRCNDVTWILCSKRPENFRPRIKAAIGAMLCDPLDTADKMSAWLDGTPPPNIIILTSVENQAMADKRIPELLKIPAACRGLSLEPLLGPVELNLGTINAGAMRDGPQWTGKPFISWLIIGGESGKGARPCNVDWIRSLVEQGNAAGVATFVKQLGANPSAYIRQDGGEETHSPISLADKKGGDPAEWPADLRIQQWPEGF